MKRILMLNYEFPPLGGGASPVSYEIAKHLSETGEFTIDVVTMGFKGLPSYEEINPKLHVYRVKCLRKKKEICKPWEQATYLATGFFKCWELIRRNKYDINYTHFIIPTGALALVLKKLFGLPYVITSHGSDVIGYNKRFKALYPFLMLPWRIILNNAKTISTPSNYLKQRILGVYPQFDEKKIRIIPNGIEAGKFVPMQKEKYILVVSRLFVNKGVQDLITSLKDVDLGEWKVKIVGEGPYRPELESKVKEYKLENSVEFLGWVDNKSDVMKELYGKASIFVLSSYFENMNITLLEAMQAGCLVIATNAGGNLEVVGNKHLLFTPMDSARLSEILTEQIKNSLNTIETQYRVKDKFEWNMIITNYIDFIC